MNLCSLIGPILIKINILFLNFKHSFKFTMSARKHWIIQLKKPAEAPISKKALLAFIKKYHSKHFIHDMNEYQDLSFLIPLKYQDPNYQLFHFRTNLGEKGITADTLRKMLDTCQFIENYEILDVKEFSPKRPQDRIDQLQGELNTERLKTEIAMSTAHQLLAESYLISANNPYVTALERMIMLFDELDQGQADKDLMNIKNAHDSNSRASTVELDMDRLEESLGAQFEEQTIPIIQRQAPTTRRQQQRLEAVDDNEVDDLINDPEVDEPRRRPPQPPQRRS